MTNTFYNPSGNPATGSEGLSALVRSEFSRIGTAFDGIPQIRTTGAFFTVFNQVGNLTYTLPGLPGTLALSTDVATETARAQAAEALLAPKLNPTITGLHETAIAMPALNIDCNAAAVFTKTITGNSTFTVSNVPVSGVVASLILELTNGGAFTITWWTGVTWNNGLSPVLTASGVDVLGFYTANGGTTWRGLVLAKALA